MIADKMKTCPHCFPTGIKHQTTGMLAGCQSNEYMLHNSPFTFQVQLSRVAKNLFSGFPTRAGTKRAVRPQEMAKSLKFRI